MTTSDKFRIVISGFGFFCIIGFFVIMNMTEEKAVETSQDFDFQNKENPTGIQIALKLESLDFFNLTDNSELELAKFNLAQSKDNLNYFSGTLRKETLNSIENRFFSIDCEELFEIGGITYYLDIVKPIFQKLDLKLDFDNIQSQQTSNYWNHQIDINGKTYILFEGEFSNSDWGIAFANFIKMLNDQLTIQNSNNRFYPIRCDNDGEMVLLTFEQFIFVKKVFPNDNDHPKKLSEWKKLNGL